MRVVVLGGAGQLGREVVSALAVREHSVCAAVRRAPNPAFVLPAETRIADARNARQLHAVMAGFNVVVNTISGGTLRRNNVESTAAAAAVAAAQEAGIERYIAISAAMVALEWKFFKYFLRPLIFRNILAEHLRVEQIVSASGLSWTIVRPPKLTNGAARGYLASLQLIPKSFSAVRADVAAFIADEVENNAYIRQPVFVGSRT